MTEEHWTETLADERRAAADDRRKAVREGDDHEQPAPPAPARWQHCETCHADTRHDPDAGGTPRCIYDPRSPHHAALSAVGVFGRHEPLDRNEVIKVIRAALHQRSGKAWSVTGGRGTAWGWITITAPPARRLAYGSMTDEDREELGRLLGLDGPAHHQGVSVPAGTAYRTEYTQRATTGTPSVLATPYWD